METLPEIKDISFECMKCKQTKPMQTSGGTGYGTNDKGEKTCYVCCAELDKAWMREKGRITLYLTNTHELKAPLVGLQPEEVYEVGNWPGTLKIKCYYVRRGSHNIAHWRWDVWFMFEGRRWHGVQYGNNSQLCHCRVSK